MKKSMVLVFALMSLLFIGCGNKEGKGAVEGKTSDVSSDKLSTVSFANLSIILPAGWAYEESESRLQAYSPDDVALVLIDDYSDVSWADFTKDPKKNLEDFLADDLSDYEYKVLKHGEEEMNGLKTFFVYYSYDTGETGTAACYTYAINTGSGIALLTFDVLEDQLDSMKAALGEIKKSVKAK